MPELTHFPTWFREGGVFMYPILLTGLLALAIVAERLWVLATASAWNGKRLAEDLVGLAERGDLAGARRLCERGEGPVARVARGILGAAQHAVDAERRAEWLKGAADEAAILTLPSLTRRLPYLNLLANTATLLGLLGTIYGLTTAFAAVSMADPTQRSTFLAMGIANALNATAFGLIVAVPTLLAHGHLVGRVESIVEQVDEVAIRLVRTLSHPAAAKRDETLRSA